MDPISATLQLGGTFLQRYWQKKDYRTQRKDALADWNMQNEYNSPQRVMERYKAAGLNPNLIYGNGTMAQADQPRSSNIGSPPEMPKLNLLAGYQQAKQQQLTNDNLKVQNEILSAQKTGIDLDNQTKEFTLNKAIKSLPWDLKHIENTSKISGRQYSLLGEQIRLQDQEYYQREKTNPLLLAKQETDNAIAQLQKKYLSQEKEEGLNNLKAATKQIEQSTTKSEIETEIAKIELGLNKKGLSLKDSTGIRILAQTVPQIMKNLSTGMGWKKAIELAFETFLK